MMNNKKTTQEQVASVINKRVIKKYAQQTHPLRVQAKLEELFNKSKVKEYFKDMSRIDKSDDDY